MKIIAISDFNICNDPIQIANLFELGLYKYHIKEEKEQVIAFLEGLDVKYWDRLSFHGDGRDLKLNSHGRSMKFSTSESCHSLKELDSSQKEYCFLSPIFNSISKKGYLAKFDFSVLKKALEIERKTEVIALGGINDQNFNKAIQLGFDGVALKGFLWNMGRSPLEQFEKIK